MAALLSSGQPVQAVMQAHKVWSNRKSIIGAVLQRHESTEFDHLITRLAKVDKMAKGLGSGDPWDELTGILLHLAGTDLACHA